MSERSDDKDQEKVRKILSAIIKKRCPFCSVVAKEIGHLREDDYLTIYLECGHTMLEEIVEEKTEAEIASWTGLDGSKPFPFQVTGIKFLESADGRALIADEMGLGKTIQALGFLAHHKEAWPFMIVTKASLKTQWYRAILNWLKEPMIQIIEGGSVPPLNPKEFPFKGYIISVDSLARANWIDDKESITTHSLGHPFYSEAEAFLDSTVCDECGQEKREHRTTYSPDTSQHDFIKTIILDECQTIKNRGAKRTKKVRLLMDKKPHVICLSGTPIKNRAPEYFPVLNILKPQRFWGYEQFIQEFVDIYSNGYSVKYGGIRPYMLDTWKRETSEFIIRRTREEVLPDLPKIMRTFQYHDLGEQVREAYSQAFDDFIDAQEDESLSGAEQYTNTLAAMSRMRHLTGLAKVEPCVDYVSDFLLQESEVDGGKAPRKLAIFAHHRDVISLIAMGIGSLAQENKDLLNYPLIITGETPGSERQLIIDKFQSDPKNRIIILSSLAAGEGINLQFCSDMIVVERQWNPANEEQGEGRFSRIGSLASFINAVYLVAIDTIDEFFAKLVEQKRSFLASTLDNKEYKWDETNLIQELTERLKSEGRKPWMLTKKSYAKTKEVVN